MRIQLRELTNRPIPEPAVYNEDQFIYTINDAKKLFNYFDHNNMSLVVTFKGDPMVIKAKIIGIYNHFVLIKRVVYGPQSNEEVKYTIPFYDVISHAVKVVTEEGRLS